MLDEPLLLHSVSEKMKHEFENEHNRHGRLSSEEINQRQAWLNNNANFAPTHSRESSIGLGTGQNFRVNSHLDHAVEDLLSNHYMSRRNSMLSSSGENFTNPISDRFPSVPISDRMPSIPISERLSSMTLPERLSSIPISERLSSMTLPERLSSMTLPERLSSMTLPERLSSMTLPERLSSITLPDGLSSIPLPDRLSSIASLNSVDLNGIPDRYSSVGPVGDLDLLSGPSSSALLHPSSESAGRYMAMLRNAAAYAPLMRELPTANSAPVPPSVSAADILMRHRLISLDRRAGDMARMPSSFENFSSDHLRRSETGNSMADYTMPESRQGSLSSRKFIEDHLLGNDKKNSHHLKNMANSNAVNSLPRTSPSTRRPVQPRNFLSSTSDDSQDPHMASRLTAVELLMQLNKGNKFSKRSETKNNSEKESGSRKAASLRQEKPKATSSPRLISPSTRRPVQPRSFLTSNYVQDIHAPSAPRPRPSIPKQTDSTSGSHSALSLKRSVSDMSKGHQGGLNGKSEGDERSKPKSLKRFKPYHEDKWMENFQQLLQFKSQHGNCLVPHTYAPNPLLARWVKRQRRQYKLRLEGCPHSTMTSERIGILNKEGFVWDSHEITWMRKYYDLVDYRKIYGHCRVPSCSKECPQLATWVKCQRRQFRLRREGKSSAMTKERIKLLDDIGFSWEVRFSKA